MKTAVYDNEIAITTDDRNIALRMTSRLTGAWRTGNTVHIPKAHSVEKIYAAYVKAASNPAASDNN